MDFEQMLRVRLPKGSRTTNSAQMPSPLPRRPSHALRTIILSKRKSRRTLTKITRLHLNNSGGRVASAHLAESLLSEAEGVEGLVVGGFVPPEPLPDAGHVPGEQLLHVRDVVQVLRQRVVHVDADNLKYLGRVCCRRDPRAGKTAYRTNERERQIDYVSRRQNKDSSSAC